MLLTRSLGRADARLFRRLVRRRTPLVDHGLRALGAAANHSVLWLGAAGLLALRGGRRGRRASARGLVAIGLASAVVNGPLKRAARRRRPSVGIRTRRRGLIARPASSSFPSGHAASALAFATSVAAEAPGLAVPVGGLAVAFAYSRIHTGVHYPSDVVAGAGAGVAAGLVSGLLLRAADERRLARSVPPAARPPRRAVLLVSPNAGSASRLDEARRALVEAGVEILAAVPIAESERLRDWVAGAAAEPLLVVAAGGDGTVGAAADQLAGSAAVLGVLPLGTSNDFARSLGIPVAPRRAVRLLATGKVSTIDAGRLVTPGQPARHFVHAATVGLNVSFAKLATKASLRRRFGRLTYAVAAATALHERPSFNCELRYDGTIERLDLVHLSVINAPVFGGFLGMRLKGASLDDRILDVIAVEHLPIRRLLSAALHPILGIRRPLAGIHTLHVPDLHVHTDRELEVALDGEILGRIPADFEVAGEALRVVTPPDFEDVDD